jgi:NosR/NirI family nitrous oxide reductase transcriptional regulator
MATLPRLSIWFRLLAAIGVLIALHAPAAAQQPGHLAEFLAGLSLQELFPGAESLGAVEGTPPVAPVTKGGKLAGYVFLNSDVVNATGYSGKPIQVLEAMDLSGTIVGARLVKHSEPIVLVGIPEKKIRDFIQGYVGYNVLNAPAVGTWRKPDIVSGATVTVLVIGDTITRAAIHVAQARGLGQFAGGQGTQTAAAPKRGLDRAQTGTRSWDELLGDGSVARLNLTVGQVNQAFQAAHPGSQQEPGAPDDTVIDLYVAPVSVPVIGRSLLGDNEYHNLLARLPEGGQAILVMGRGDYSWRGSGYVRGGIFDRIALLQGYDTIRFRDRDYRRIGDVRAEGAPQFPEVGLFMLPAAAGFDPAAPWRLQLLVRRQVGALEREFVTFELPYTLPERYLTVPPSAPPQTAAAPPVATQAPLTAGQEPLWQQIWRAKVVQIGILLAGLFVLTVIFYFQDLLVKRPRLHYWVRTGFLAWTLLWLGWWALAQLSVVNVLTIANALVSGFSWDYFLMDPLLFILWAAVAAALVFWGRGAFCGWLCPFGALQEFVNRLARLLRIPQLRVPWGLHQRLWTVKYIIFLGLFGTGLYQLAFAEHLAEVEPFKTAIVLHFVRDWPFVVFAVLLLVASLFIERFFCRYLCPLGAGLAIPAKIRTFEWLKRHHECGRPCQRCAVECPVDSIHPDGRIDTNECIYCMHCQVLYWHEYNCPAMIQRRLRRERAAALGTPPPKSSSPPAR